MSNLQIIHTNLTHCINRRGCRHSIYSHKENIERLFTQSRFPGRDKTRDGFDILKISSAS